MAKALKLPVDKGVLVNEVVKDGPADKAGIEGGDTEATIEGAKVRLGGDIITEIDGKPIGVDGRRDQSGQRGEAGGRDGADVLRGDNEKRPSRSRSEYGRSRLKSTEAGAGPPLLNLLWRKWRAGPVAGGPPPCAQTPLRGAFRYAGPPPPRHPREMPLA